MYRRRDNDPNHIQCPRIRCPPAHNVHFPSLPKVHRNRPTNMRRRPPQIKQNLQLLQIYLLQIYLLTMQESLVACPAHNMASVMPPGAVLPYRRAQSLFLQIGTCTFCRMAGWAPCSRKLPHPATMPNWPL